MKEENFKPGEFTPLGNGMFPDEKTLALSKELTQDIINRLGPVTDIVRTLEVDMPIGQFMYLTMSKSDECTEDNCQVIGFEPVVKYFQMQTFNASTETTMEQLMDLEKLADTDVNAMINDQLIDDHVKIITKEVLDKIKELSNKNIFDHKDNLRQRILKIFFKLVGKSYIRYFKVDDTRKLVSRLLATSNMLAVRGRRGPATYIICSSGMAAFLADSGMYDFKPLDGPVVSRSYNGFEHVGNIVGIKIMVDRYMKFDDMTVYVGRKSMEGEPGIYMPIMTTGTAITKSANPQTMAPRFLLRMRRCLVNTDECESRIAELKFKFTGKLKKEFLGK